MWSIPVRANVVLKSNNIPDNGTKKTDEPKPLMVPTTSLTKAKIKNSIVVSVNSIDPKLTFQII